MMINSMRATVAVVVCHQAQHPQAKQLHFCVDPRNSFWNARVLTGAEVGHPCRHNEG